MGQQRPHVPYRNSMMTQVLRDSLGGNCRTVMIANITAQHEQLDESISTCRFAQRVAMVSNQVWYPPCTNLAKEKAKTRLFGFNEKPTSIPGCPGCKFATASSMANPFGTAIDATQCAHEAIATSPSCCAQC